MSGQWGVGRAGVRGRGWVVVAVGALLVAGCSDGGAVTPEPTASLSAEPSPSVDVRVPPTRPAEWDRVDLIGAKAVAGYFMQLYAYAYATGDLTEWNALSHPECVFCSDVSASVTGVADAGEHFEGGDASVVFRTTGVVSESEMYSIDLTLTRASSRKVGSDGVAVSGWSAPEVVDLNALVLRENDAWKIYNIDVLD